MKVLAIESSCDETAAAVIEYTGGLFVVKSNIIASQIEVHQKYGGVVPEIASRKHIEAISYVAEQALCQSNESFESVDAIGVTYAPGLVGALLVGVNYAKSLAFALNKPLVPVHHVEGHISAIYIEHPDLKPPFVCLVASGGHSSIVYVKDYVTFEPIAKTRDDAAGEAFDKIARVLGLGYPGGPAIQEHAKSGCKDAIQFPRVNIEGSMDFSFSGVKTAVINYLHRMEQRGEKVSSHDVAASLQQAICETLTDKLISSADKHYVNKIALAGGVAANKHLRQLIYQAAADRKMQVYVPSPSLCTDNAVMIGVRAIHMLQHCNIDYKTFTGLDAYATKAFD